MAIYKNLMSGQTFQFPPEFAGLITDIIIPPGARFYIPDDPNTFQVSPKLRAFIQERINAGILGLDVPEPLATAQVAQEQKTAILAPQDALGGAVSVEDKGIANNPTPYGSSPGPGFANENIPGGNLVPAFENEPSSAPVNTEQFSQTYKDSIPGRVSPGDGGAPQ